MPAALPPTSSGGCSARLVDGGSRAVDTLVDRLAADRNVSLAAVGETASRRLYGRDSRGPARSRPGDLRCRGGPREQTRSRHDPNAVDPYSGGRRFGRMTGGHREAGRRPRRARAAGPGGGRPRGRRQDRCGLRGEPVRSGPPLRTRDAGRRVGGPRCARPGAAEHVRPERLVLRLRHGLRPVPSPPVGRPSAPDRCRERVRGPRPKVPPVRPLGPWRSRPPRAMLPVPAGTTRARSDQHRWTR